MYALRTFTENSEVNNWLGDQYEIIRREECYERFSELFKDYFEKDHLADLSPSSDEESQRTYAFIINSKNEPIPIYKEQKNYIVTESGKTYSNITYK